MVDIISKKASPRKEDVAAKRLINQNWPTISRLADQISNGGYTRSKKALAQSKIQPEAENLSIHIIGEPVTPAEPDPVVRLSMNNRVLVMDANSGKQLQFLGEFRFQTSQKYFVLANKKNGFFSTIDEETEQKLEELDGVIIESAEVQEKFVQVIKARLDL